MVQQNRLQRTALIAAIAIGVSGATSVRAESLDDLKQQLETLQKQVRELEQKQRTTEKKQVDAVTAGATKGSFRLPGSNTSVTLGGYVKLDAVYSDPSAGTGSTADLFLQPNAIAVGPGAGDNEHKQVKLGARESRLFVKTSTPSAWGDIVTHIEGDLYGSDGNESVTNSHGARLRHAYGSIGPFLGGQTWTTFMYVPSLPETLDFGGPVGQVFVRQAQVRWTQPFAAQGWLAAGQWSAALENPEAVVTLPGGVNFRADDDRFPDLTGQVLLNTSKGRIALSALLREIRADSKSPVVRDQTLGGALSLAGVIPTVGKDDVRVAVSAGNAIGRYSNGFFPDGVVTADGQITLPKQFAWYAAYRHFWADQLRSSVVLSSAKENNPAGSPGNTNESTRSAHANVIWSPATNTDVGLEYIYARRETEDGLNGHLNRLQASAKYAF